jgi:hypothetical protein
MGSAVDTAVAIVMAIVISGLTAIAPSGVTGSATGDDQGCADLFAYRNDVYGLFGNYPTFTEWWANSESPAIDAMQPDLAEVVVSEGRDFVEAFDALDVPPAYAEGNDGWVGLYAFFNDLITWVVLGDGDEPDTDDLQEAVDNIAAGESNAAAVCPDEIEDLDGFVLYASDALEDIDVPADPLDIDKDFL